MSSRTAGRPLPVDFVSGRFYVCPVTTDGQRLRFLTDTGGGLFITRAAVERLGLSVETASIGDESVLVTDFPAFSDSASIPTVAAEVDPRFESLRGRFVVQAEEGQRPSGNDGMLGQVWFGGRTWTFDYPAKELRVHESSATPHLGGSKVPVGFPVNASGRRGSHFPSIEAAIDGETHAFLFDSGATVRLSQSALGALGGGDVERGTSFVTASLFERWRVHHPEWPVVPGADVNAGGEPMIEVSSVQIANYSVGPVWFTRRADRNFHDFMSSMMDRRVEGALGASLLSYFRVTLDYPNAIATFERSE